MKHRLHSCNAHGCSVCRGGLQSCDVCGGAESSLTDECCGRRMTSKELDAVTAGKLDFVHGHWSYPFKHRNTPANATAKDDDWLRTGRVMQVFGFGNIPQRRRRK